jgi:hypothetical protein
MENAAAPPSQSRHVAATAAKNQRSLLPCLILPKVEHSIECRCGNRMWTLHDTVQDYYFGEDFVMRRQDYTLDVAGSCNVANYALDRIRSHNDDYGMSASLWAVKRKFAALQPPQVRFANKSTQKDRGAPRRAPEPSTSSRSYLRAAQAYMLISMPTCTSTIVGVFQAIRDSQVSGTIAAVKYGQATQKWRRARCRSIACSSIVGRRTGTIR